MLQRFVLQFSKPPLLAIYVTHPGAGLIFVAALTILLMAGIPAFHALAQGDIVFAGRFFKMRHKAPPYLWI